MYVLVKTRNWKAALNVGWKTGFNAKQGQFAKLQLVLLNRKQIQYTRGFIGPLFLHKPTPNIDMSCI